jgi:thioredoxin 1
MPFTTTFETTEPTREEIDTKQGPLVLEFGTPWCGHCLAAQPLIEAAFSDFPTVRHLKIEDGRGRPLGRSYRVKLWPTLIFLESGKEVARLVRPTESAPIVEALAQIVDDLDSTAIRASE